jgi:trimeric autotransporter adhesin
VFNEVMPMRVRRCVLSVLITLAMSGALAAAPSSPAHADIPIDIVGPSGSGGFGTQAFVLSNGNIVVTDPLFDLGSQQNVGAIYLYNGLTRQRVSTLTGTSASDFVGAGGIIEVGTSDFVVSSGAWDNGPIGDAGAVTWIDGTSGLEGFISPANSMVGSTANDVLGDATALANGNYVVIDDDWTDGVHLNQGAVRWANGTTGAVGTITVANSLTGAIADNRVGIGGVVPLTNGNYVVASPRWELVAGTPDVGAATWQSGTGSSPAVVSAANSLVGGIASDLVGLIVQELTNGNYVVASSMWNKGGLADVGAATWGNGATGTVGPVGAGNSLVGSTPGDNVGLGVTKLTNGDYVVDSNNWRSGGFVNGGAATWRTGTSASGGATVSAMNSIIGSAVDDHVGYSVALSNGNYVVAASLWNDGGTVDVGAVRWGDGFTTSIGPITLANSLHGSKPSDFVGTTAVALTDGNYVIGSGNWHNAANVKVGAATWRNGSGVSSEAVTFSNSLVGSTLNDGIGEVTALLGGRYVVSSFLWDNASAVDAGAVSWAAAGGGPVGPISAANSLVGSSTNDALSITIDVSATGAAIVAMPNWNDGAVVDNGAVTVLTGPASVGAISTANSMTGPSAGDRMGYAIRTLPDGRFAVRAPGVDNGPIVDGGSVTLVGPAGGPTVLTSANSVFGKSTALGSTLDAAKRYTTEGALVVNRVTDNIVTLLVPATAPVFATPGNISVIAPPGAASVPVSYSLPVATDNSGPPAVACNPPSGSNFPVGTTTVTCLAADQDGLVGTTSFTVTVTSAVDFVPLPPARLADTRAAPASTVDGQFANLGLSPAESTLELMVVGRGGVGLDAAAVALNVTATEGQGAGFITVFPCGEPRPTASNLNQLAGSTVPNAVIAKVGAAGKVCFFNQVATHLVVDVGGYFPTGTSYQPINPLRLMDTRDGPITVDGQQQGGGLRVDGAITEVDVAGRAGIPGDAGTVALNVTVTESAGAGFVTVYPCGEPRPLASSLNAVLGSTVPNLVIAKIGAGGKVCMFNQTATHLVVDADGYFPALTTFHSLNPARLLDTRPGAGTVDNVGTGGGPVPAGTVTPVAVVGRAGVPTGATAVVLNATVTETQVPGFVTVFPCGIDPPLASNLNYGVGTTAPNAVIVKVGTDGMVCLFNSQGTHLVVDINGYL